VLKTHAAPLHLQQIFTGFSNLARLGVIRLSEQFNVAGPESGQWTLTALVNGKTVVYDVGDNHLIDESRLKDTDFYFKRSFHKGYLKTIGAQAAKVHPLGMNYEVYPSTPDFYGARRNFFTGRGIKRISGALRALNLKPGFVPRQDVFEGTSKPDRKGGVLFLTRTWDPNECVDRDVVSVQQREQVNDMRARCIEYLRRHFGTRVLAGFAHTEFAARKYPKLLVPDPRVTVKHNFLAAVQQEMIARYQALPRTSSQ